MEYWHRVVSLSSAFLLAAMLATVPRDSLAHPSVGSLAPVGGIAVARASSSACFAEPPVSLGPEYYSFTLAPTRNIPHVRHVRGYGTVTFAESPFDLAVSGNGSFVYEVSLSIEGLEPPSGAVYVAWVAQPDLKAVRKLGALDSEGKVSHPVDFNKFIVFVTVESAPEDVGDWWKGPIILTGRSRSARLQSMASHGFFEREPC